MTGTLVQIYRREGIIYGLYRGMSINYLRAIPMVAVSFTTYELMKQMLKLDTGIKIEWYLLPSTRYSPWLSSVEQQNWICFFYLIKQRYLMNNRWIVLVYIPFVYTITRCHSANDNTFDNERKNMFRNVWNR